MWRQTAFGTRLIGYHFILHSLIVFQKKEGKKACQMFIAVSLKDTYKGSYRTCRGE